MRILLTFDKDFPVDTRKLMTFLSQKLSHIKFELHTGDFEITDSVISNPSTFLQIHQILQQRRSEFDRVFCFTEKKYTDNYFFHEHDNLSIFSFYAWSFLTDLPISNGIIYFIVDYIALNINPTDFRHQEITGCIYDFLGDKRGIDDGMRQARFCSNCLQRISNSIADENQKNQFTDLSILMDHLSDSSRWNKDVLETVIINNGLIAKRKAKSTNGLQIVIASPGDTETERKILLDSLERKFRIDNHEEHCGFRVMVNGWEDLASQNGYAQDVINSRLIQESDFVIAVFKHKLGTPTNDLNTGLQRAESGTAEELLQALDKSKNSHPIGMAYFYSKAPIISLDSPDKEKIEKEWTRLTNFKKTIQDKLIYKPYTDSNELLTMVLKDLEKNIIAYMTR